MKKNKLPAKQRRNDKDTRIFPRETLRWNEDGERQVWHAWEYRGRNHLIALKNGLIERKIPYQITEKQSKDAIQEITETYDGVHPPKREPRPY